MIAEGGEVEIALGDDRGHASAAIAPGHGDAVDIGLKRAVELTDNFLDFGGRHILTLPAEGVADAVNEIEIAVAILAHQVAGAEPEIALREGVVQDLLLGLGRARIALESRARLGGVPEDAADHLARLVISAFDTEAVGTAHRLLPLDIEAHDLGRKAVCEEPRHAADRAFLALEIEQVHVAFGGTVELDDVRNLKPPLELRPNVGPQAVAAGEPQMVRMLL